MNILIIDDNAIKSIWSRKQIEFNFRDAIFFTASNGIQAKNILEKEKIDFIVLDMQFSFLGNGDIDDLACMKVLEEMHTNKNIDETIPVCICTSGGKWDNELDKFKNLKGFIRYQDSSADEKYKSLIERFVK